MKKVLVVAALFASTSFSAFAQTGAEVPSLQSVLGAMNEAEVSAVEATVSEQGSFTEDIDVAIEQAVSEAVSEGLITAEQAADAAASLQIVNSNAEFFNFDILATIGEVIEQGASIEDVRATLEGFQNLSDAGKSTVGNESFSVYQYDNNDNILTDSDNNPIFTDAYNSLSDADKAVINSDMPLLSSN